MIFICDLDFHNIDGGVETLMKSIYEKSNDHNFIILQNKDKTSSSKPKWYINERIYCLNLKPPKNKLASLMFFFRAKHRIKSFLKKNKINYSKFFINHEIHIRAISNCFSKSKIIWQMNSANLHRGNPFVWKYLVGNKINKMVDHILGPNANFYKNYFTIRKIKNPRPKFLIQQFIPFSYKPTPTISKPYSNSIISYARFSQHDKGYASMSKSALPILFIGGVPKNKQLKLHAYLPKISRQKLHEIELPKFKYFIYAEKYADSFLEIYCISIMEAILAKKQVIFIFDKNSNHYIYNLFTKTCGLEKYIIKVNENLIASKKNFITLLKNYNKITLPSTLAIEKIISINNYLSKISVL